MKHKFLLSLLALGIASIGYAEEIHPSVAVEQIPINDTIVNWQDNGMIPLEDGKAFASLCHNKDGIYFQVLVKDRQLQQQFLRRGLVVYVDPNGKKKKKYAVHFPTLAPPQRPQHPDGHGGQRGGGRPENRDMPPFNPADTAGLFSDIRPEHHQGAPHRRPPRENRERSLKMLLSQLATQPASFYVNDDESLLSADSTKITASGNNLVFSSFIGYKKLGKIGKKNQISLGVTVKQQASENGERPDMPQGGMFGPPPGMGGGMMPPPGMGGRMSRETLKEDKNFADWLVFSTKISNFTE